MIKEIFVSLAGLALAVVAFVLIRFNIKRIRIVRAAARATPQQLEDVYRLVEECGTEVADAFVLGRTNQTVADPACRAAIPENLQELPWAGRVVVVEADKEVNFHIDTDSPHVTQFLGIQSCCNSQGRHQHPKKKKSVHASTLRETER